MSGTSTQKEIYFEDWRWHIQISLEWHGNTAYRSVWWTHMEKLGLRILDVQVVIILSTSEG